MLKRIIIALTVLGGGGAAVWQLQQPSDTTIEGTLEISYEDHEPPPGTAGPGRAELIHEIVTDNKERVRVKFTNVPPGLKTGERVRVRGKKKERDLEDAVLEAAPPATSVPQSIAVPPDRTIGPISVLVNVFNFATVGGSPGTTAEVNAVNAVVRDFYLENSYGQTPMTFTVTPTTGVHTINATPTTCTSTDYNNWANLADAQAQTAGITPTNYQRRFYIFPSHGACSWAGVGNVGGPRAWSNGYLYVRTFAHELGHNFGNYHSKQQTCVQGSCSIEEYGDTHDVMGQLVVGHMNAFQKDRLGWLAYGPSPTLTPISVSGSYTIDAFATTNTGLPKGIKILHTGDTYIYAEMRTAIGFDAALPPGVIIHTGSASNGSTSLQIDTDAETGAIDVLLDPGQSFTFPAPAVTIATTAVTGNSATLQVTMPGGGTTTVPATTTSPTTTVPATTSAPTTTVATTSTATTSIPVNQPPTLAPVANVTIKVGQTVSFTLVGSDPEGQPLMYTAVPLPSGATLNASTGAFLWTPTGSQTSNWKIAFSVSDGESADMETARINVQK